MNMWSLGCLCDEALQLLNDAVERVIKAAEGVLQPDAAERIRREASPSSSAGAGAAAASNLSDARASLRSLAVALWREGTSTGNDAAADDDADAAAQAASSAGDLCHLLAETKTFFKALPGTAFTSPYVQVGSTGGGAGVVHQMEYGRLRFSFHSLLVHSSIHWSIHLVQSSIRPLTPRLYAAFVRQHCLKGASHHQRLTAQSTGVHLS